jgi:hypothetical protein
MPAGCPAIRIARLHHLPTEFARLLFESSNMGMTVVISEEGKAPVDTVHPSFLMPIDAHTGAEVEVPRFAEGEDYRWQPELSPNGPVSMVMSRSDRRISRVPQRRRDRVDAR